MSTNFEPMSGDALTTWASGNPCAPTNLAQTALHHLARAKAAEEARDLAIAERDEAYRQRDELGREGDTAHALLNGSIGSRVVPRKGETALVSQARTAAEVVADLRLQLRAIDEPAQTFPIQHEVTIAHGTATIKVAPTRDPLFLALPMNARLALVVTRG